MKIAIVGAGAIGCWLAAQMSLQGCAVTLVARGRQYEAIARGGLVIESPRREPQHVVIARVVRSLSQAEDCDVLLLTVKAHQLAALIPELQPFVAAGATLVSLQNGLPWWWGTAGAGVGSGNVSNDADGGSHGNDKRDVSGGPAISVLESVDPGGTLLRALPDRSIIAGVLYVAAEVPSEGRVRVQGKGRILLGDAMPAQAGVPSPRCLELAALLASCGMACEAVPEIRKPIWQKLWRNAPVNPLSVLTGATLGDIAADAGLQQLCRHMMAEVEAVAMHEGILLSESPDEAMETARRNGAHKTSMLQDYERGRPIELGALTGAIIELADHHGVPVPHLRSVHACTAALVRLREAAAPQSS